MPCPNGHDTRNEIGNCFTCGEAFPDAGTPEVDPGIPVSLCPNGHDTRNEIGRCFTCGEAFLDADVLPPVEGDSPVPPAEGLTKEDLKSLSRPVLHRLKRDAQYMVDACALAIAELDAKKDVSPS